MIERLDGAIIQLSDLIKTQLGIDVSSIPGAGAAGGLGAGAVVFMGAGIASGIDTIINVVNLEQDLQNADWIITGEGRFDSQSLRGKVISGIVNAAKKTGVKVVVIAGDVQINKCEYNKVGVIDAIALKKTDMTIEYAIKNCRELLKNASCEFVNKYMQ
jgi:glycerate kinase